MPNLLGRLKNASAETKLLLLLLIPVAVVIMLHYWLTGFIIYNDGLGYYGYLHSLTFDRDINFTNEWADYNASYSKFSSVPKGVNAPPIKTPTGYPFNSYLYGTPLMWLPFFLTAHAAATTLSSLGLPVNADGYSWPYEIAIGLATLIYGFLAVLLIYKFCRKWFDRKTSLLATIGVWYGTGVFWYHAVEPSMSHINSMLTVTAFAYFWHNTLGKRTRLQWLILGLLLGLVYLVRQQDILVGILPMLELLKSLLGGANLYRIRKAAADGITLATGTVMPILPQMFIWKELYGSFIAYTYPTNITTWAFPQLLPMIFSLRWGMWRVPMLLLALAGFFLFAFRVRGVALYFLAVVVAETVLTASWTGWTNGYGIRLLVGMSVFFALGAAEVISRLRKKVGMKLIYALVAALIIANFVNMFLVLMTEVTSKTPIEKMPAILIGMLS